VHTLVGDWHKEGRWSMVDGEEWWRPWRRARVPGEGPTNVERWSVHEHRGVVGMLFRYLSWPEVERKGVVGIEKGSGFSGGKGGTGFTRFRLRRGESSARVGRGASRGGEEAFVTFRYLGLNYTRSYYKVCMFDLVYVC
jgi:hypothetical protein